MQLFHALPRGEDWERFKPATVTPFCPANRSIKFKFCNPNLGVTFRKRQSIILALGSICGRFVFSAIQYGCCLPPSDSRMLCPWNFRSTHLFIPGNARCVSWAANKTARVFDGRPVIRVAFLAVILGMRLKELLRKNANWGVRKNNNPSSLPHLDCSIVWHPGLPRFRKSQMATGSAASISARADSLEYPCSTGCSRQSLDKQHERRDESSIHHHADFVRTNSLIT